MRQMRQMSKRRATTSDRLTLEPLAFLSISAYGSYRGMFPVNGKQIGVISIALEFDDEGSKEVVLFCKNGVYEPIGQVSKVADALERCGVLGSFRDLLSDVCDCGQASAIDCLFLVPFAVASITDKMVTGYVERMVLLGKSVDELLSDRKISSVLDSTLESLFSVSFPLCAYGNDKQNKDKVDVSCVAYSSRLSVVFHEYSGNTVVLCDAGDDRKNDMLAGVLLSMCDKYPEYKKLCGLLEDFAMRIMDCEYNVYRNRCYIA